MFSASRSFRACKIMSAAEAVKDITDGTKLLVGGFGVTGQPHALVTELAKLERKDLHCICESAGAKNNGLGVLFEKGQVKRLTCSFLGRNAYVKEQYIKGNVEVEFVPQGTLAERIRAGGAGIPAFYARAGAGTWYEEHGFPIKYQSDGIHVDIFSDKKEVRKFNGHWHCLEESITAEFGLVKAWKADTMGNLVFKDNTINYNKVVASAGKTVIAEVEEIVPAGELNPNEIVVPCIYVDRIVKVPKYTTMIEEGCLHVHSESTAIPEASKLSPREKIARRGALELKPGMFVNLGVGIPCEAGDHCECPNKITMQGENGMLGIGPYPSKAEDARADIMNAARQPVTPLPHTSYFGSEEAFAQIRGGHLDLSMLGGLEVSQQGDLASWLRPGQPTTGMGGSMELVTSSHRVVVTMTHLAKGNRPKIVSCCNLPLTGKKCVDRIITEYAVFDVDTTRHQPLTLVEIADGMSVDQLREITDATFVVSADLKPIEYAGIPRNGKDE